MPDKDPNTLGYHGTDNSGNVYKEDSEGNVYNQYGYETYESRRNRNIREANAAKAQDRNVSSQPAKQEFFLPHIDFGGIVSNSFKETLKDVPWVFRLVFGGFAVWAVLTLAIQAFNMLTVAWPRIFTNMHQIPDSLKHQGFFLTLRKYWVFPLEIAATVTFVVWSVRMYLLQKGQRISENQLLMITGISFMLMEFLHSFTVPSYNLGFGLLNYGHLLSIFNGFLLSTTVMLLEMIVHFVATRILHRQ